MRCISFKSAECVILATTSSFVAALLHVSIVEKQLAMYNFSLLLAGIESWSWFWKWCLFGEPERLSLPGNENILFSKLVKLVSVCWFSFSRETRRKTEE